MGLQKVSFSRNLRLEPDVSLDLDFGNFLKIVAQQESATELFTKD